MITVFATENGKEPFREWLESLTDIDTKALVFQRMQRIKLGNFGDCKSLDGGLWEFRIHHKAGIRIYYSRVGKNIILLIGAGAKRSQRRDINQARKHLKHYWSRENNET